MLQIIFQREMKDYSDTFRYTKLPDKVHFQTDYNTFNPLFFIFDFFDRAVLTALFFYKLQ